jgi:hypothetical protein
MGVSALAIIANSTHAQPSELLSCFEPGTYCAESPLDTLSAFELGCDVTFVQFVGRLAFPPLVNRGPVTIAVRTLSRAGVPFPLYVEMRTRVGSGPDGCTTLLAGNIALVAQGLPPQCGGVWETVGPIDLTQVGVPLGWLYHVQLVGFVDGSTGLGSAGVACVRVSGVPSTVIGTTWQRAKCLYRE